MRGKRGFLPLNIARFGGKDNIQNKRWRDFFLTRELPVMDVYIVLLKFYTMHRNSLGTCCFFIMSVDGNKKQDKQNVTQQILVSYVYVLYNSTITVLNFT